MHTITGSETLNARFPGQWFQVESGLHYYWHRHYDPTIGRYTQPDPLGFVDGPSVYAYAGNAPGEAVDPDGRIIQGFIVREVIKQCLSYGTRKLKEFLKDEQGAKKRDTHQVDDAFKQAASEAKKEPTDELRRRFRDEIHDIKRDGQGDLTFQQLVEIARRLLND
ncbi:MAG: RHS repeat-associated core domain-containing protein [Hyphomicrobium sp.]